MSWEPVGESAMKDLNDIFIKAKAKKIFKDDGEIEKIIRNILQVDSMICLDWDKGVGEDWIRFYREQSGVICMLHKKIGIAFVKTEEGNEKVINEINELYVVEIENYNLEEWCIDLDLLRERTPEMSWNVSPYSVDVENMSLNDLYFATV